LAAGVISTSAYATGKLDKELMNIIQKLSSADNYCYALTITSVIQGKPAEKETQKYLNYNSKEQFLSFSGSNQAVIFINRNGMFKADIQEKQVYYVQFNDSSRQQWQKFAENASGKIDSVLLHDATVVSKISGKATVTYKLKYPAQSEIKEMSVVCNTRSGSVNSISYTIVRPLAGTTHPDVTVKQTVTMDHYEQNMPQEVKNIMAEGNDLYAYLQKSYAGYAISKL
jgi:hypothetical protein